MPDTADERNFDEIPLAALIAEDRDGISAEVETSKKDVSDIFYDPSAGGNDGGL